MAKNMVLIPFIDVLYALAIGSGFSAFPKNPPKDYFGTVVFIYTLLIAAQDWFEYHDKADIIPDRHRLGYVVLQIFVILTLNQMFVHATSDSLVPWLVYAGVFCLLNGVWNVFTPFVRHYFYAVTSTCLAVVAFVLVFLYPHTVANYGERARWLILVLAILIPVLMNCIERKIDK